VLLVRLGEEVLLVGLGEEVLLVRLGEEVLLVGLGEEVLLVGLGEEVLFVGLGEEVFLVGLGEEVLLVGLGEDQGLLVVSAVMPADVQQGVHVPLYLQLEAVKEAELIRTVAVIEGQRSALIVQEETDPVRGRKHRQDHSGGREGFVNSVLQSDQPHSALWTLPQLGLTIGRSFDQTETPFRFVSNLHLYVKKAEPLRHSCRNQACGPRAAFTSQ